jgi:hypothetical protein
MCFSTPKIPTPPPPPTPPPRPLPTAESAKPQRAAQREAKKLRGTVVPVLQWVGQQVRLVYNFHNNKIKQ